MKNFGKDFVRLIIVIVVLVLFVYIMPPQGFAGKNDILLGTVSGGVAAFFLFLLIRFVTHKNKK
ncbi:MAG: hypothetical protein IJT04_09255 [Bacteroidales bacterium]|nr:hypothetical protein [Bacteroidales bacterium]